MKNLIKTITYIVSHSTELKNKFTNVPTAPVEFACIFCQSEEEYKLFTHSIEALGKVVERTQSGFTYLLDNPIETIAGPLRLIKIRKPDTQRPERGDADFNTDYNNLKTKYQGQLGFDLITRESFEMLRLSDPDFDVMACFSNIPKSKDLGIRL
ncbi:hypothetical protein HYV21_00700 [Candidatus Microgenomates bacterium]|nr:hypothetical protein [Candidatus Microgenomates bacterium]